MVMCWSCYWLLCYCYKLDLSLLNGCFSQRMSRFMCLLHPNWNRLLAEPWKEGPSARTAFSPGCSHPSSSWRLASLRTCPPLVFLILQASALWPAWWLSLELLLQHPNSCWLLLCWHYRSHCSPHWSVLLQRPSLRALPLAFSIFLWVAHRESESLCDRWSWAREVRAWEARQTWQLVLWQFAGPRYAPRCIYWNCPSTNRGLYSAW